jgi:dihydrolipoamide dehydrogenase
VEIVHGVARFSRADRAAVLRPDGNVGYLEFRDAIIATGSRPVELAAVPFDGVRVLDSTGLLALDQLPTTLAVIGGGVVGLELGMAMAKLGSSVTIIEARDQLLPGYDRALSEPVRSALVSLGATVELSGLVSELTDEGVRVQTAAGEQEVTAERVLVAVGRRANTDGIGLDLLPGVRVGEDGLIAVGADLRAADHVAAIGDVVAGPPVAHKAVHQGQIAAETLSGHTSRFEPAALPEVVFTDPEIATAGLSETAARATGMAVRTATFPLSASGRAATLGHAAGFTRLVIDETTDRIVGVQIVGPHASELIAEGTLAIEMMASPSDLAETIHAHPTLSESLGEAALVLDGRPLHARDPSASLSGGRSQKSGGTFARA